MLSVHPFICPALVSRPKAKVCSKRNQFSRLTTDHVRRSDIQWQGKKPIVMERGGVRTMRWTSVFSWRCSCLWAWKSQGSGWGNNETTLERISHPSNNLSRTTFLGNRQVSLKIVSRHSLCLPCSRPKPSSYSTRCLWTSFPHHIIILFFVLQIAV